MVQLHTLQPSGKDKKRRRGRGGSRGGTAGKGHKGQKARSGGSPRRGFEGGQMPLHRRLPKRGFNNHIFKISYSLITLEQLEHLFKDGMLITKEILVEAGCVKKGERVKLLANGLLSKKLTVTIDACSKSAKEAIERVGGEIKLLQE